MEIIVYLGIGVVILLTKNNVYLIHAYGLMEVVMNFVNVNIFIKDLIFNVKNFQIYVLRMELIVFLSHHVLKQKLRLHVSLELMEFVVGYLQKNVRNLDNVHMLLVKRILIVNLMDINVLLMETHVSQLVNAQIIRHQLHVGI